jgi:hypothetical protein
MNQRKKMRHLRPQSIQNWARYEPFFPKDQKVPKTENKSMCAFATAAVMWDPLFGFMRFGLCSHTFYLCDAMKYLPPRQTYFCQTSASRHVTTAIMIW